MSDCTVVCQICETEIDHPHLNRIRLCAQCGRQFVHKTADAWLHRATPLLRDVPEYMRCSFCYFVCYGWPVGDFLTALLKDQFCLTVGRADANNIQCLRAWASLVYECCPTAARGEANYEKWQKIGGLVGLANAEEEAEAAGAA